MPRHHLSFVSLEDRVTPAVLPAGFTESLVAEGLRSPIAMTFGPDGSLYIAEQAGVVRVVRNGQLSPQPFAGVAVGEKGFFGERGLLGFALDPNFATNAFVYLTYSPPGDPPINRVSRFRSVGEVVDPASETVLIEYPGADGHNGGALGFGADGKLYIATGDLRQGQIAEELDNLHGKILRINADGSIPADNPFRFALEGSLQSIWARGFRNPFTFAFQPGTGRLFINDVGDLRWEEINEGVAGGDFGWPRTEGPTAAAGVQSPVFAYEHPNAPGNGAAITAGVFYNPPVAQLPPEFENSYLFVDFLQGWIRRLDLATGEVHDFATDALAVVDLDVGPDGGVYYLDRDRGVIRRIRYEPQSPPAIQSEPADLRVSVGEPVTFSAAATGTGPFAYQWFRAGQPIPGANAPTLTIDRTAIADNGVTYRLAVTNAFGESSTRDATLTVLNSARPTATIDVELNPAGWAAGETIRYSARATDAEDGQLPPSALVWEVEYHTGEAVRPYVLPFGGVQSSEFATQTRVAFKEPAVFFRIRLTATDSSGLSTTTTRDVFPRVATLTIESDLAGTIRLDGQPLPTPSPVPAVVGLLRTLEAESVVVADGVSYRFAGWSNGGPRSQELAWPTQDATIRARYERVAEELTIVPPGEPVPGLPTPPALPPQAGRFAVASGPGRVGLVRVFDARGQLLILQPFDSAFRGGLRVATGDVTGDSIADVVVVPGPGGGPIVRTYDGATGADRGMFLAFEPSFRGGLFVASADIDGDGFAEIVLSPDGGGGPRVRILNGRTMETMADFIAIEDANFRGGVRTALGDINGDGVPDLVVAVANRGGPRVAVYDGTTLASGAPTRLVTDFFAFEPSTRGGAVPSVGDMNGDGEGELVFGAGAGGAPRVLALDGRSFLASGGATRTAVADFFAADLALKGGVSVTARDTDGDGRADLMIGLGGGAGPLVTVAEAEELLGPGVPSVLHPFLAFEPAFRGGVFVG